MQCATAAVVQSWRSGRNAAALGACDKQCNDGNGNAAAADLYFRNKVAILLPQTHTAKLGHLRWECMGALVHICAPGAKPSQKENLWAAGLLSVRSCGACTASVH